MVKNDILIFIYYCAIRARSQSLLVSYFRNILYSDRSWRMITVHADVVPIDRTYSNNVASGDDNSSWSTPRTYYCNDIILFSNRGFRMLMDSIDLLSFQLFVPIRHFRFDICMKNRNRILYFLFPINNNDVYISLCI